jgi:putative transposase
VRGRQTRQTLSYVIRLPDEAQADALRLLDASRTVVNEALIRLWPSLDAFATDRSGVAYQQVAQYMGSPDPHGNRQWRCESETAGRILRTQATRKRAFTVIQPLPTAGFIVAKTARKPAGKNRRAIKEALTEFKQMPEEERAEAHNGQEGQEGSDTRFIALQNVVEQACNYYFEHDRFPASYEEMQPIPLLGWDC